MVCVRVPEKPDSKAKMIESAMVLQRRSGVAGTAFSEIIAHSGAPRGSIYHHFPGGKAELAESATRRGVEWVLERVEAGLEEDDPIAALDAFIEIWVGLFEENEFMTGCAVAAGALDPDPASLARPVARAGFHEWEEFLTSVLGRFGISAERSSGLALILIASIEGALILTRAEGGTEPLERVADQLRLLLRAELLAARA
jgi:TetR/AcrR family transcriptional regulator, lmrAB and yxaGH operons repressor